MAIISFALILLLGIALWVFLDEDSSDDSYKTPTYTKMVLNNYQFFYRCYCGYGNRNIGMDAFYKVLKQNPNICNVIAEQYFASRFSQYSFSSDWSNFIRDEFRDKNSHNLLAQCIQSDADDLKN